MTGATSSWHISEKKPQKYKYHIQAIGKRDDTDAVLDTLKTDITHMEVGFDNLVFFYFYYGNNIPFCALIPGQNYKENEYSQSSFSQIDH